MPATDFEARHPLLLHQLVIGCALVTYLFDREDVVWRLVKNDGSHVRLLERASFAAATLLFGISALLCTLARAYAHREATAQSAPVAAAGYFRALRRLGYFGEFLYALALGSLFPVSGFFLLVIGEAVRLTRLARRDGPLANAKVSPGDPAVNAAVQKEPQSSKWVEASRLEALKWGLFLTMIVFTWTLQDRIAEVLIAATVLLWGLLNLPTRRSARSAVSSYERS